MQLLLLGKAVAVALMADEIVLPGEEAGQCGLLAIYLAVCSSIIGLAVQYYAAESLVSGDCVFPGVDGMGRTCPVIKSTWSTSH